MPKYHDCKQGSPEWIKLRLGIPTASSFEKILTPSGKASTSVDGYMRELLSELILGHAIQAPTLAIMQRGHDLEATAVSYYEFQRDVKTKVVGFVTTDDGSYGASPDREVGEDGLLEIKCPTAAVHVGYMLTGGADRSYWPQLQGQLLVTGRKWVDIVSYHPDMDMVLVRVERDEEYINTLSKHLAVFCDRLRLGLELLKERGYYKEPEPEVEHADWLNITDEEIERMCAK
jgi:hypothetical protein